MSSSFSAPIWNRSEIYSFYDLSETEQATAKKDVADYEETQYVKIEKKEATEVLPLNMFMRTEHTTRWDGVYGTSYFSAYFIKFNSRRDECVICERFS